MSLLPLTRTKDESTKEPAFIILGKTLKYVLGFFLVIGILTTAVFYQENSRYDAVKVRLHGVARSLHLSEHEHLKAHAEIAKVGEEFEEHLDRDLRDLEAGQRALRNMRTRQGEFEHNMTAIVHATLDAAIEVIAAGIADGATLEAGPDHPPETAAALVLTAAKADLSAKLEAAAGRLFSAQNEVLEALVHRLAVGAKEAVGRKGELQEEILHNLHEQHEQDHEHEGGGGDGAGDAYLDDPDPEWDGGEEGGEGGETDDHWAKSTELWQNETVDVFFVNLHEWLHPEPVNATAEAATGGVNGTEEGEGEDNEHHAHNRPPHESYTNTSELFKAMKRAREDIDVGGGDAVNKGANWRYAQKLIHEKAAEIKAAGLPPYTDADEPEDDGYQGFQSWHVQSYLDDLLWPAELRARVPELLHLKARLDKGDTTPSDSVEYLEGLAAENVVPHHWLHHGAGGRSEYYYGGGGGDDY